MAETKKENTVSFLPVVSRRLKYFKGILRAYLIQKYIQTLCNQNKRTIAMAIRLIA